jgi:S-adenosylmethionine synthetase
MWGYATDETPNYMPLGMFLARGIMNAMRPLEWNVLFADCKTQVTIEYDSVTNKPIRVSHVVISCLHDPEYEIAFVRKTMRKRLKSFLAGTTKEIYSLFDYRDPPELIFNHAGSWVFGGPAADTGVTGRKIVVDAYGAECEVGGGAFSGKDGTKVDRSGAYAARFIAKNIVAAKLAKKCKVQLGYVIGQAEPVSFNIDLMGTGRVDLNAGALEAKVRELIPLTPSTFIERFKLTKPRFAETAINGHFGVDSYPWENLSLVPFLKLL